MNVKHEIPSRRHARVIPRAALVVALVFGLVGLVSAQPAGGGQGGRGQVGAGNQTQADGDRESGNRIGDAVIQYDYETDSLIILSDEETSSQIESILQSLDQPVPQVLIKVLFLEVTHTDGSDIGVQALRRWDSGAEEDQLFTDFGLDLVSRGAFWSLVEEEFEVLIRLLAETSKLEVLSRPSILTRNNEPAIITIGQEIPFVRNSRVTDDGQIINTIEYEDIGIILEVTPHITADRLVEMDVYPEISTLTGETVQVSDTFAAEIIAKRSAQTRVVVQDGRTVVIGGLMEDNFTEAVQKVPVLGDIPILGMVFKRTIRRKTKTELLIFLTPYVIDGPDALTARSIAEKNLTEITPNVFDEGQRRKFIDNLGDEQPNPEPQADLDPIEVYEQLLMQDRE